MSLTTLHTNHADMIFNEITDALEAALSDRDQNEPRQVASLVKAIPEVINDNVAKFFYKHGVLVSSYGIFVHQQPQVKSINFPKSKPASVEIGDLLLINTHIKPNGDKKRYALLLQAKKAAKIPAKPDNTNQLHLYLHWPPFEYTRSKAALNGEIRQITGPNYYSGAKYLLLRKSGKSGALKNLNCAQHRCVNCSGFSAATAYPQIPYLSNYECFSSEIYNLLFGNAGREFIYKPKNNEDWDQVITDMIDTTAHSISKLRDYDNRGYGVRLFFSGDAQETIFDMQIHRDINRLIEQPPRRTSFFESYDEDIFFNGISIIEVVVKDASNDHQEKFNENSH